MRYFGTELDMTSWYIHQYLEKLIDGERFGNDGLFVMSDKARQANKDWIAWWNDNGPNRGGQRTTSVVHNAEPHSQENGQHRYPQQPNHAHHPTQLTDPRDRHPQHPSHPTDEYQRGPAPAYHSNDAYRGSHGNHQQ